MRNRAENMELATKASFDIVIIGGGLAGAAIAEEASRRGLSILLVERADFGSGASGYPINMICGRGEITGAVEGKLDKDLAENLTELKHRAPHLVHDFQCLFPFKKQTTVKDLTATTKAAFQEVLGRFQHGPGRAHLGKREMQNAAPGLEPNALTGGLIFDDCAISGSRLILNLLKAACGRGSVALNYMEATAFQFHNDRVKAVVCRDRVTGEDVTFSCTVCVVACGQVSTSAMNKLAGNWLETPRSEQPQPSWQKHNCLVVPASAIDANCALALRDGDKDFFACIFPWQSSFVISSAPKPTESESGMMDGIFPASNEIDSLLTSVNEYLQPGSLRRSDVVGAYVRFERANETLTDQQMSSCVNSSLINEQGCGIISVQPGKSFNFLTLAKALVDGLSPHFGQRAQHNNKSSESMLGGWLSKEHFIAESILIGTRARRLSIAPGTISHLIANYGSDASKVLDLAEREPHLRSTICPDFPAILAEILYIVHDEMAICIEDVLFRRLQIGLLHHSQALANSGPVANLMQQALGWSLQRKQLEIERLRDFCPTEKEYEKVGARA